MNCQYRTIDKLHLGYRVRKTKDKNTIEFDNKPLTDIKIESWDVLGFTISHPELKKEVRIFFNQIELNNIDLQYGYIKNPMIFVEEIKYNGIIVIVRADTFDYKEMLEDKKNKEKRETYTLSNIKIGDRITSSICKDSNVMVFLGVFNYISLEIFLQSKLVQTEIINKNMLRGRKINIYGEDTKIDKYSFLYNMYCISNPTEQAFFLYEKDNGNFSLVTYSVTNKVIKNLFKCKNDVQLGNLEQFSNEENNLKMLIENANKKSNFYSSSHKYGISFVDEKLKESLCKKWEKIQISSQIIYPNTFFFQLGKENIKQNACSFLLKNPCKQEEYNNLDLNLIFLDEQKAVEYAQNRIK